MSRLRVAVIGAGNIAQRHLPVLGGSPDCEVAVLCDANPAILAETAQRFTAPGAALANQDPPQRLSDVGAVLARDDLDAVFVLVSVLAVSRVAAQLIAAGMPSFIEKPPGIASAETAHLAELQQRHGTVAVVGLNRRFYSSHLAARERLLAHGPVATVTVDAHEDLTRASNRDKFPPLVLRRWAYANGIHALDLLRFFGGEVTEVDAERATVEGAVPDGAPESISARLRYASGARGRAAIDWIGPGRHRFEVRTVGATATSRPSFGSTELAVRGQPIETIEPDEDDRRYKAGFWKQDVACLAGVRAGKQPAWPSVTLADAHATMVMIDRISGFPPTAESAG